jgi:hypothetical protein
MRALGEIGLGLAGAVSSPSSPAVALIAVQAILLFAGLGVLARLMWMTSKAAQEATR